jgi:asparagine synthase (glutamine-hydrolysing)
LFGSRDRFGVKPMYRLRVGGLTGWASEIKALLTFPGYSPAINWRVAGDYLRDGFMDHTAMTFFESIEAFPAGTGFTMSPDGEERRWRFWEFPSEPAQLMARPEEAFRELFEDAVRLRLRSDVPVAVSLSGGLDSTSIICSAHRSRQAAGSQDPLRAFLYHHPAFDEQSYVAATVEQTGERLHRLEMGHQELWELAEQVLRAHDEPVHTLTAMVGYRLMHLIAESGVKVILSGQGSDEVLGGYDSFFLDSWYTGLRAGRVGDVWRDIGDYTAVHGGSRRRLGLKTARRVIQGEFQLMRFYRRLSQLRHLQHLKRRSWFEGDLLPRENEIRDPLTLELNQVLQQGVRVTPLPLYLRVEDRNSMANSVEVRLPFLDYRLVEFAFRLGPEWKVRGPWNKVLLRGAMKGCIPEIVRARPDKMGFPTPTGSLMVGESYERLFALVSSRRAQERGVYAKDRMIHDLEKHREKENPVIAGRFFRVAQFELWAQLHGL